MALLRRRGDETLFALFEEAGRNAHRTSELLRDELTGFPESGGLAGDLKTCEHEGDRITHDIILRLRSRGRGRLSVDPADGHALAAALDDVVDYAEQAGDWLGLYGVEGPMSQAEEMAEILVSATTELTHALRALRDGTSGASYLVEVNRLENEGDRIHRDAVASLFADGIDPMVVIRWKDIFDALESAVDACETVAHILEGIAIKRGR